MGSSIILLLEQFSNFKKKNDQKPCNVNGESVNIILLDFIPFVTSLNLN